MIKTEHTHTHTRTHTHNAHTHKSSTPSVQVEPRVETRPCGHHSTPFFWAHFSASLQLGWDHRTDSCQEENEGKAMCRFLATFQHGCKFSVLSLSSLKGGGVGQWSSPNTFGGEIRGHSDCSMSQKSMVTRLHH